VARAQENYCEFVVSHIPKDVRTILDVGCGSGSFALRLLDLGYQVDCVSPSSFLTKEAARRLDGRANIYDCRFEDLETQNRYDLILFSESFQYVPLEQAFGKVVELLAKDSYMLICDFFRKDTPGNSRIGGGHRLSKFHDQMERYPFAVIEDIDITNETAPTMDLANDIGTQVLSPIWDSAFAHLGCRYPRLMKVVRWKFRKSINKVQHKYLQGERSGEHFSRFKTYRLMLLKKKATGS
jgi:SAM-dependent methyltransferase